MIKITGKKFKKSLKNNLLSMISDKNDTVHPKKAFELIESR